MTKAATIINRPATLKVLRIDASMRYEGSVSRQMTDELIEQLKMSHDSVEIKQRDLAHGISIIDESWIGANFTDPAERNQAQRQRLEESDKLVNELRWADVLVIGIPIYNFGPPAAFKAWIDLIARARETFRYSDTGPVGLLEDKQAFVVISSGGVSVGSEYDFVSPYVRQILGFVGIHQVEFIAADGLIADADAAIDRAREQMRAASISDVSCARC